MSASLANKVAIVTSAARGIEQTTAEALAAKEAKVVINYAHDHLGQPEGIAKVILFLVSEDAE